MTCIGFANGCHCKGCMGETIDDEFNRARIAAELVRYDELDSEAARHVESVICMRTHFTGNPPYVGWRGLGLALTETLDRLEAELAQARAERDVLMDQIDALRPILPPFGAAHGKAWHEAVQELRAERDAAQRDAERYRWLRDKSVPPHNFYLSVPIEFAEERYTPQQVDAAIDAARSA